MKIPAKILFLALSILTLCHCSQDSIRSAINVPIVTSTARATLGKDFGNKYFYQPKFDFPRTPSNYGFYYENLSIPSSDGVTLHGWLIHPKLGISQAKQTIIYSHGNLGSIGYHISRVKWMVEAGFNVVMYDYRGYGKSTGKITRKGLIDDAYYAMKFTSQHPRLKHTKLISHGHSLGGAKSIAALALHPKPSRLILAVNESSFASYQQMAVKNAGNAGARLVTETYSPHTLIHKISVPVIIIHGANDRVTPIIQGRQLRSASQGSTLKAYWEVSRGNHFNTLSVNSGKIRKQLIKVIKSM